MYFVQIAVLVMLQASAANATDRMVPKSKFQDIITLRDERAALESQKRILQVQISQTEEMLRDRVAYDQVADQLKRLPKDDPAAERYREELVYYNRRGPWNEGNTQAILEERLRTQRETLMEVERKLQENERNTYIATLIERERQRFMNQVSWIFGGLVAILVIGFFWVVLLNKNLSESIFRGAAGLQMITLLSVVIAIILFGITGVLEGKELAALLGGLTGYILGRVADREDAEKAAQKTT